MIKNTKVQYSAKEAKLILRAVDAACHQYAKDEDDRAEGFRYVSDADIALLRTARYGFSVHDVQSVSVEMSSNED